MALTSYPAAQWPEDKGAANSVLALRFTDDGGRLVLSDAPGDTEVLIVDDGAGRLVLDDTQASGLKLRARPDRIFLYD
jgi:hypothetical protein